VFTRPDLDDDAITEALRSKWNFGATHIEYAPVGFGSHHWHVSDGANRLFVTIDDLWAKQHGRTLDDAHHRLASALASAARLREAGLDFVVAPLPTIDAAITFDLSDRYVMAVYPHCDGQTRGYGPYATEAERHAVLDRLIQLHSAPDTCRAEALVDDFELAGRRELTAALGSLDTRWETGPFAEPARQLLAANADGVVDALRSYDTLVDRVRTRPQRMVLTHGEPHPANTIVTAHGVQLIDWDTALIAPPERDLWELAAEDPAVATRYDERTGTTIDPDAIELYRLCWDLSEVGIYISEFRQPHTTSDDTSTAWTNLQTFLDSTRW